MKDLTKTYRIIKMLNGALDNDPTAIKEIMSFRVPANQKTQDHPFIQVTEDRRVGALGIINAILAALEEPLIAAIFDESKELVGFTTYPTE